MAAAIRPYEMELVRADHAYIFNLGVIVAFGGLAVQSFEWTLCDLNSPN